jgi:putative ABC transport system substrate-binding protein
MKDKMTAAAKAAGLTVVAVPISSPTEGAEATTALIAKKVGAIEIYGNAAHAAFESIIKVAKENKVPVFSPSPFEVVKGATAAFFPDFQEGGVVAGGMVAKALKGESLGTVPFYKLQSTKTSIGGETAAAAPAPAQ